VTEIHPTMYDLVPSVASSIWRRYNKFAELDDIKQECYIWAMQRATYITEQLSEPKAEERKHNESRLAWQMRRVAERYARKEKSIKSGYNTGDEAYYDQPTVGRLLPFVIASIANGTVLEVAQDMALTDQPKGKSSPSEGGNLLVTLIDIKKAFVQLDVDDQLLLRLRYHEHYTLQQIGAHLECAVSTADRRCASSLHKLIDYLGGRSPYN